jgi:pyruvate/2-oxoacid:ferredoxin oxidoreductase beta subunit
MDPKSDKGAGEKSPLIPVKSITFRTHLLVDLHGRNKATASGLKATEPSDQEYWRIWYDPRLRHHRVEYYKPGKGDRKPEVRYIPESWCSWEPVS